MKAKLQDKFVRVFAWPLCCGISLSIIMTVGILLIFGYGYITDKSMMSLLQEVENKKTLPTILNVENLLFKHFQLPINTLLSMKKYYFTLTTREIDIDIDDKDKMKKFINEYSINCVMMARKYDEIIERVSSNNNSTFLDYSNWQIDKNINNTSDLNYLQMKQIYIFTNMNLLLKAHYEVNELRPEKGFRQFWAAYANTNLIAAYPISSLGKDQYEPYQNMSNPSWCINDNREVPDYYYFYCRPWYIESLELFKSNKLQVMISSPYKTISGDINMAVCVRFQDPLVKDKFNSIKNDVLFCTDIGISDIVAILDQYNNLSKGYFFIMRINSDIPVYYPNLAKKNFAGDMIRNEFGLNTKYYVDDLMIYKDIFDNFKSNVNATGKYQEKSEVILNGQNHTYTMYPVYLNLHDNPDVKQHIFSIIYVSNLTPYISLKELFKSLLFPRIYLHVIIFLIMGGILFLIAKHLIKAIAINIVKPIKFMKRSIVGINDKNLTDFANLKGFDDSLDLGFKAINKRVDSDDDSDSENETEQEDEDEYVDIKSVDIEELFNTMVSLKKVFSFTQNISSMDADNNILNYLFAKYTFKGVNNLKGTFLCDSNIGNLAIKCKKYDKAIFHLGESIEDNYNTLGYIFSNYKSDVIPNNSTKQKYFKTPSAKHLELKQKEKMKLDFAKKKFLDSRYPKIIYAFKKYYKNLNKILKSNTLDQKIKLDMFSTNLYHSLGKYQKYLEEYLILANVMNDDKKKAEALLEINEFYLNFHLKPSYKKEYAQYLIESYCDEKQIKENSINIINQNFILFDKIVGAIMSNISVSEYMKKILEMMEMSKKESSEIIEIPVYVLVQKANYLKGKFCFYCQNYKMAFSFFNESKNNKIISHAQISRDSVKKLKKIIEIISRNVENNSKIFPKLIEGNKEEKKKQRDDNNKLKETKDNLEQYMVYLNKESEKYKIIPKDIAIMLNFSYSPLKNDEHEINRNNNKIEQSIKVAEFIFKNYVTSEDRFTLFTYTSHGNPLIHLTYKDQSTLSFIKDQFKNLAQKEFYSAIIENGEPCLFKSVETVYRYLNKKNETGNREKWIIAITDHISKKDLEYLHKYDIHETLFENSENINLILVEVGRENQIKEFTQRFNFNKSGIVHINRINRLRSKMKIVGNISDEVIFMQEKYDNNK